MAAKSKVKDHCAISDTGRKAAEVEDEIKASNTKRLRRIEGQVRGIQKMVEEERYCSDIMIQIAAVQESLRAVGQLLLRNHLKHCVNTALKKGSENEANEIYEELLQLFAKYSK